MSKREKFWLCSSVICFAIAISGFMSMLNNEILNFCIVVFWGSFVTQAIVYGLLSLIAGRIED